MPPKKKNFETTLTRKWREGSLPKEDERTVSNIEEFGCSVISVKPDAHGLGWSYTIGVFDTSGKPEIITVGLKPETAHSALNEAARLLRMGVDLTKGVHREIVGEVDCIFRPVDQMWVKHLMGWAQWYYDGADFPVLQAIYPDLENRFQGEKDFNSYFEQPMMQPAAPRTRIEDDFWASADPDSSLFNWKFEDSPHTRVFLSEAIHEGTEEVTYVSHDADDGAWQFLGVSMTGGKNPVISCFHHPIDHDPSLSELADLPLGWYAERDRIGAPWVRKQLEPEDPEQ